LIVIMAVPSTRDAPAARAKKTRSLFLS